MSEVLWRRLGYMLSPQLDIYKALGPHVAEMRVVDIGFGTGFGTLQLAEYTSHLTGIEIDAEAVRFANHCVPGIRWEWGDISRGISYIVRDMDAAIMIEVLEHVEEWREALQNVCAILRPEGKLIISARNAFADLRKNELHEREWTAMEFYEALDEFFQEVWLYDYTLQHKQDVTTRMTPLVAVAVRKRT